MRQRIEVSTPLFIHVCRPSLPSRPTMYACESLSPSFMAPRIAMYLRHSGRTYLLLSRWSDTVRTSTISSRSRSRVYEPAPRLSFVYHDSGPYPSGCSFARHR